MRSTASLSLDQAPPISVPFRFFLTAPLFGMLGGLLLSRWSPLTLAFTHLFTLGVLALVMCGAMVQMLPVLAGAPVPQVVAITTLVHPLLSIGTLGLAIGLGWGERAALAGGAGLLGVGLLLFLGAVGLALARVKVPSSTVVGMRGALAALAVTAALGLTLVATLVGNTAAPLVPLTDNHLAWGLMGWVGLLVIGVSYQVVPMFQITPEYPRWMQRGLVIGLLGGLAVWSLLQTLAVQGILPGGAATLWMVLPVGGLLAFAATTLQLQQRRTRRIVDTTLLFWRVGLIALLASGLLWLVGRVAPAVGDSARMELLLGVGVIFGGALSLLNGMLYKIVPFLSWFHLQNRQMKLMCLTVQIPNMKELIPEKMARLQFRLHLAALTALAGAVFLPMLARPAGLLMAASFGLLGWNLARATLRYREVNGQLLAAASPG